MNEVPQRLGDVATSAALASLGGIAHGFFSRNGGASHGIYASLNCGPASKDDGAHVHENRRRVARHLGVAETNLLSLYQIHSPTVVVVDAPWDGDRRPQADGMVTRVPGLALGILAADCGPILFCDPAAGIVGAAHAGWRGAASGVLEATVEAMVQLGAAPARIVAALGPTIARTSYEVGPEFPAPFLKENPAHADLFAPSTRAGHFMFDLPAYIVTKLRGMGLGQVDDIAHDTCADERAYFSYRRSVLRGEPGYGRNISAIALAG
ncbi:MAG: peptidoglycan editing factor PgeF [Alphaproteobacteria bacterium]